jgi:hypothetical protein
MKGSRRGRLLLLPLIAFGAVALPQQAFAATGTLEICKQGANGVSGTFQFRVNGGSPVSVPTGRCSGPLTVTAGNVTVTEVADPSSQVVAIAATPKRKLVSSDLDSRTAVVKVARGSTAADETVVTFTNGRDAGQLKVCKIAGSPDLLGDAFSFRINGGSAFSINAGSAPGGNCSALSSFAVGTNVTVSELPTAGTHISSITVSDGRGSGNINTGNTNVTIGSGVTIVTYTNVVNQPPQQGFIEVCKEASDAFTSGSFHFTIVDASGASIGRDVRVGQCSDPIQVAAGNATVTESANGTSLVSAIEVTPADREVDSNLINRTVTVEVPQSADSSDETLVTFFNRQQTGQFKVCKTLAANAGALAGSTFVFDVSAPGTGVGGAFSVVAGDAGTTACRVFPTALPIGAQVSVTERSVPNVRVTGVSVSPAGRDNGSSGSTAAFTIGSGITTATFTNQALATLEVCKNAADASTAGQTFQFSVNGGAPINVRAGQCSPAMQVPAGTATVRELAKTNFSLVSVSANDSRLLSGPTANPATVAVPFGGVANETVVTFTNRVNTGQFKLCKQSPEPTLQTTSFSFNYSYTVNGTTFVGSASLRPGECSALSLDIPVVDASGNPITVNVSEGFAPTVQVSDISLDGSGTLTARDLNAQTASFTIGQGVSTLTYTNVRTPIVGLQGFRSYL